MSAKMKIGILTSGGDAPGMNAAIRAIVRAGETKNIRSFGVRRGFEGLLKNDMFEMNLRTVSDVIQRGGTFLFSSRCAEFKTKLGTKKAAENCKKAGLDALIIIGGDGSLKGAKFLSKEGINCIFIPGTIDNDVASTEYTIGFDTATNTAMEMIDKIRDTAQSHEKCSVVEVMGRRCGDIALHTGIAVGATAILVPEVAFDFEKDVIERIKNTQRKGKRHFIVVASEGLGIVTKISKEINLKTGINTHFTVLGHVQRGGSPTLKDRLAAARMSCRAVEIIAAGEKNRAIVMKSDEILDMSLDESCETAKKFDFDLYQKALEVSI